MGVNVDYTNFKTVAPANCPDLISVVRVAKTVTGSPAWGGIVTYTLVLTNSRATDPAVQLVDTLPRQVDFRDRVQRPQDADVANDILTWAGAVSARTGLTFTFRVDLTWAVSVRW